MQSTSLITIRDSTLDDLQAVSDIYSVEVLNGSASFEEVPPTIEELSRRRDDVLSKNLPYIIAEIDGEVAGYAYVNNYRTRHAYRFTVENSVYVNNKHRRKQVGATLLQETIDRCEQGPWQQMIAIIGDTENKSSIALHQKLGFRKVGVLQSVGFKHNRWVDTVMMQRALCSKHN